MIPVGVACSCLVVSYLCVYATGKGRGNWFLVGDCVCSCSRAPTLTFILDTLTHLLVQAGEQCVQYKGKC